MLAIWMMPASRILSTTTIKSVKARADVEKAEVIPICVKTEQELSELDDEERDMFMEELGLKESGLDSLIRASYKLLGLISFLTDGQKECRAWTIRRYPLCLRRPYADWQIDVK